MTAEARTVIEGIYAALGSGDREALLGALADDVDTEFAAGMPAGGGPHPGAEATITDGWWAIGAEFAVLAQPEEWIACEGDRLLVRGTYRGKSRATGRAVEAAFDHLWTVRDGKVVALRQLTDTAAWQSATDG